MHRSAVYMVLVLALSNVCPDADRTLHHPLGFSSASSGSHAVLRVSAPPAPYSDAGRNAIPVDLRGHLMREARDVVAAHPTQAALSTFRI